MRQACELGYAGLVKLLIVAYCYVDCSANTVATMATQLQLLLAAIDIAHNSSPLCVCARARVCVCGGVFGHLRMHAFGQFYL